MCPLCITTTLALVAGSVTTTGAAAALVTKILRNKTSNAKVDHTTELEEKENESSAIQTRSY